MRLLGTWPSQNFETVSYSILVGHNTWGIRGRKDNHNFWNVNSILQIPVSLVSINGLHKLVCQTGTRTCPCKSAQKYTA